MTTILQPSTTRAAAVRAPRAVRPALALDGLLGGLERAAARLPHALALPVMVAHAAISTVVYR